jgi:hypothetical protein
LKNSITPRRSLFSSPDSVPVIVPYRVKQSYVTYPNGLAEKITDWRGLAETLEVARVETSHGFTFKIEKETESRWHCSLNLNGLHLYERLESEINGRVLVGLAGKLEERAVQEGIKQSKRRSEGNKQPLYLFSGDSPFVRGLDCAVPSDKAFSLKEAAQTLRLPTDVFTEIAARLGISGDTFSASQVKTVARYVQIENEQPV